MSSEAKVGDHLHEELTTALLYTTDSLWSGFGKQIYHSEHSSAAWSCYMMVAVPIATYIWISVASGFEPGAFLLSPALLS